MPTPWISFGGPYAASEEAVRSQPAPTQIPPGTQKLAAAMLLNAKEDLETEGCERPRYWDLAQNRHYKPQPDTARTWVTSQRDHPGSFVWCCQALRADPDAVRDRLMKGRAR